MEYLGATGLELKNLCVIESAAKYHPNNHIYVLMTSPTLQDTYLHQIQSKYKNIHVKYIHLATMIQGSPLEILWKEQTIQSSKYLTSHLRLLELKNIEIYVYILPILNPCKIKPLPSINLSQI